MAPTTAPDATITTPDLGEDFAPQIDTGALRDALVIVWSPAAPDRIGEVALLAPGPNILGRGGADEGRSSSPDGPAAGTAPATWLPRVHFMRQRPGTEDPRGQLREPSVSREQIHLVAEDGSLVVERRGKLPLFVNGKPAEKARLTPGDTLMLRGHVLLLYVRRRAWLPPLKFYPRVTWPFGAPDPFGIVGESPVIWQVRDEAAFFAQGNRHALITGESGTGKELAARTIHAFSLRASKPFFARNAATLPPGLIDAELFGNARNYPNPGTPERPGIIGQADGSTLFLDEIGEMPLDSQAHLLRVLDAGGEYQRLGEPTPRRSRFCLVAATNRSPSLLKHDVLSRFAYRTTTPTLQARREDIPLLVCHLLRGIAKRHSHVASFFDPREDPAGARPRIAMELVDVLVRWEYTLHLRELEELLVRAVMKSHGDSLDYVDLGAPEPRPTASLAHEAPSPDGGSAAAKPPSSAPDSPGPGRGPEGAPSKEEILSALDRHRWIIKRAFKDLGLQTRFQLYRLMDKHGILRPSSGGNDD